MKLGWQLWGICLLVSQGFAMGSVAVNQPLAKVIQYEVQLKTLEAVKTAESSGDELYVTVTHYPAKGQSQHVRIPKFPSYWLSSHVNQIQGLSLWRGRLAPGETDTIILSLIEHDTPPLNSDDLIGTIRLRAHNAGGELRVHWRLPNLPKTQEGGEGSESLATQFTLEGEDSHYILHVDAASQPAEEKQQA